MLTELIAYLCTVGIAVTIFMAIMFLSDKPVKALITALTLSYSLFFIYIFILKEIAKRKEEKHTTE
jgi:Ca2+/Na+ antiporter